MPLHSTSAQPLSSAIAPPASKSATTVPAANTVNSVATQIDPLSSPHPLPWDWVMTTHANFSPRAGLHYYRSPSLVSPDGRYAAYSRLQMLVQPELYRSRVSSVMFVENLQTGELQVINTATPWTNNWLMTGKDTDLVGTISILTPVSWSKTSDRLLARQFAGLFSSSDASDFAVIWHRTQNRTSVVAPQIADYDIAVLLGWSQFDPERVLFRAGNLGDQQWSLWAVADNGQTIAATEVESPLFGVVNYN